MKPNLPTLLCLLATPLLPLPLQAQVSAKAKADAPNAAAPRHRVVKTSDIIGMNVQNKQDEILGQVDDLVVDVESGRIVLVVLSIGGSLRSVSPLALQYDATAKSLCLDASQQKLQDAPAFEMEKTSEFNIPPYMSQDIKPPSQRLHWQKVSRLISLPVKNYQGQSLGRVENLLLDFPAGRVVALVISSGAFIGREGELSAVPPSVMRFTADNAALQMSGWKESMIRAPHFKPAEWPDFSDPTYIRHVYGAYQMRPYFADEENASDRGVK